MTDPAPSKPLHIGLWVVQVLLAIAFGMAGAMKAMTAAPDLVAQGMAWAGRVPGWLVPIIGVSELLGAIGLILPSALRIQPKVTGVAALALLLVMVLAGLEHGMAGELSALPVNVILGGMCAFVAWGRLSGAPIAGR
ncbi:MAG: putative oxidoreductase [Myxococcota bacterium]|jgi:putative oxidoreductase